MRKARLFYHLALAGLIVTALQGCRKENGIDNNNVVKRPYGLYVADVEGTLYNTTTGNEYKLIFPPDGYGPRAILTSGTNLLWVKRNVHLSLDNGRNFNPTDTSVTQTALWQALILNVPSHGRIYLCSGSDYFGLKLSEDNGKTWRSDTAWNIGTDPFANRVTSLAQLKKGTMFAFDHLSHRLVKRAGKDDRWEHVEVHDLPATGMFYLSRFNDILVLTDYTGVEGVWHSENDGVSWAKYTGLPARALPATAAPFDQVLLVGTDSLGVYSLSGNTFSPVNNGLGDHAAVRGITGKNNIYKNDLAREYYYLATSIGVFRSDDRGENWIQVFPGNFTAIY